MERRFRRKDGNLIWTDVSGGFVPATENQSAFFAQDVSDMLRDMCREEGIEVVTRARITRVTAVGAEAGEIIAAVQVAMLAGLPYAALRDAIFTHPTMSEGLIPLFSAVPASPQKIT